MVYNLLHYEGLFVGASSALNMVGAVKTEEAVGEGSTVGKHSVFVEYLGRIFVLLVKTDW